MTDRYETPLGSRYASNEMLALFSQDTRYQTWRKLWVALTRAEMELGLPVTAEQVAELEAHITDIDYELEAKKEAEPSEIFRAQLLDDTDQRVRDHDRQKRQ